MDLDVIVLKKKVNNNILENVCIWKRGWNRWVNKIVCSSELKEF